MWTRELGLTACTLAALLAAPADTEGKTEREGDHYKVVCHFENDAAADRALEAVEALWPFARELYDLPKGELEEPLVVNLYRNRDDYNTADKELTGGQFEQNMAFAHWDTMTAHVALQPELSDEALTELGLPALTLRQLAHEAAHLARYSAYPNYRSHPDWIANGAASWIDAEAIGVVGSSSDFASVPFSAREILSVKRLMASDGAPGVERIFRGELDGIGFYERYGLTHLFFRFLVESKHKRTLDKLLTKAWKLGGGEGYGDKLQSFVFKSLNKKKLKGLDKDFREYLQGLEPEWDEVFRAFELRGEEWVQLAFPDVNAIAWRTAPPTDSSYTIRGELKILPGQGRQLNVLLDRTEGGFVSVAFVADVGMVAFDYSAERDEWEQLAESQLAIPKVGESVTFEVAVEGGRVTARLGEAVVSFEPGPRDWAGPWGLGAQAGTAGIWRGVTAE